MAESTTTEFGVVGGGIGLELAGDGGDSFVGRFAYDGCDCWIGKSLDETFHSGGHGGKPCTC